MVLLNFGLKGYRLKAYKVAKKSDRGQIPSVGAECTVFSMAWLLSFNCVIGLRRLE